MVEKYVNIKAVLAKIRNRVGNNTDLEWNILIEWVSEVLQKLSCYSTLVRANTTVVVDNHRAEIPCNVVATIALTYNGTRLRYGMDERNLTANRTYPINGNNTTTNDYTNSWISQQYVTIKDTYDEDGNLITTQTVDNTGQNWKFVDTSGNQVSNYYIIDGGWYKFSLESGNVELDYWTWRVDDEGLPEIPDNTFLHEAMLWYVTMNLVAQGMKIGIFEGLQGHQYCKAEYEKQFMKAKGSMNFPSYDEMVGFTASFTKLVSDFYRADYYGQNSEARINEGNSTRQGYNYLFR